MARMLPMLLASDGLQLVARTMLSRPCSHVASTSVLLDMRGLC